MAKARLTQLTSKKRLIAITTGDSDGIGLEITYKALHKIKSSSSTFLIFRNKEKVLKTDNSLPPLPKSKRLKVATLSDALAETYDKNSSFQYIEIQQDTNPAEWVQQAAELCLKKQIHGLVTGPVSKKTFIDAHLDSVGHTPLLSKTCQTPYVYMGFLGQYFNVILATGHIPLQQVESQLNANDSLKVCFETLLQWRKHLPKKLQNRPLGVLGLNPHSGEDGLIGNFENQKLIKLISSSSFKDLLVGPLVPDVAFFKENWSKYSFFVALYHDQGLIPFKMTHGRTGGCHVSVGLPIIRTSVDHGTAKDIYGKGIAKPDSMVSAISWCEVLIRQSI